MIRKLLSAALGVALVLTAAPVLARDRPADLGKLEPLISTCRSYVQLAYETGDLSHFDAYIERLIRDRRKRQAEIIACGAYLAGAMEFEEGRIVQSRKPRR